MVSGEVWIELLRGDALDFVQVVSPVLIVTWKIPARSVNPAAVRTFRNVACGGG